MGKSSAGIRGYKTKMQKEGITLYNQHAARAVPQTANPVSTPEPGLGAKTFPHPFISGKKPI